MTEQFRRGFDNVDMYLTPNGLNNLKGDRGQGPMAFAKPSVAWHQSNARAMLRYRCPLPLSSLNT